MFSPSVFKSLFSVILLLQKEMRDPVDILMTFGHLHDRLLLSSDGFEIHFPIKKRKQNEKGTKQSKKQRNVKTNFPPL